MSDSINSPASAHVGYFDGLRAMATVCVIYMHTAAELLRTEVCFRWDLINICTSFAFTAVPLFIMMSGYLLLSSERTTDVGFLLKRRLPRLAVPLAAWTVIEAFRTLLLQGNLTLRAFLSLMIDAIHNPIAVHFWYMYLAIALYVISPMLWGALHALDRRGRRYLFALIVFATVQTMASAVLPDNLDRLVAIDLAIRLKMWSGYLCTFFLGYLLGSTKRRIPNLVLFPAAAALWAVIALGTRVLTLQNGEYTSTFQAQNAGFEVALAACLFLIFKQNARPFPLFRAVPLIPLCLPVYLMHNILLSCFHHAGYYPGGFSDVLHMTLLNLVICYFTTKTAASIRPLCFPLTGLTYQDACRSCNWQYTLHRIRSRLSGDSAQN